MISTTQVEESTRQIWEITVTMSQRPRSNSPVHRPTTWDQALWIKVIVSTRLPLILYILQGSFINLDYMTFFCLEVVGSYVSNLPCISCGGAVSDSTSRRNAFQQTQCDSCATNSKYNGIRGATNAVRGSSGTRATRNAPPVSPGHAGLQDSFGKKDSF